MMHLINKHTKVYAVDAEMCSREKHLIQRDLAKPLREVLSENHAFLAGGAITSIFTNHKIHDYDFFFKSAKELENVKKYLDEHDGDLKWTTDNAYSYRFKTEGCPNVQIQLIRLPHFIREVYEDILLEFDYTICMGGYAFRESRFYFGTHFLAHNAQKRLVYNPVTMYPLSSLYRLRKFLDRGYYITGSEIIKLGLSIQKLEINSWMELREQIMGIDTQFLSEITDKLMTDEYKNAKWDFNEFLGMVDDHLSQYLDNDDAPGIDPENQ
jgi:hypothetical protein